MTEQIFFNVPLERLKPIFKEWVKEVLTEHYSHPEDTTDDTPEYLTRKQVSELLGVSLVTLDNWVKRGMIPALRIGYRVRFKKEDVQKALKEVETLKYRRV